ERRRIEWAAKDRSDRCRKRHFTRSWTPTSRRATINPTALTSALGYRSVKEELMDDITREPQKRSWDRPDGASFESWMKSRVARGAEGEYDWNALKFQADHDPKYRRAQKRFIGTGGTGVASDSNVIPAEHFTLSNMILPPGAEGPMHLHIDAEEVFFVLRGTVKVMTDKTA